MAKKFPLQPLELVDGVVRFQKNHLVHWMLEALRRGERADLNHILIVAQERDWMTDYAHLMQLIGYSIDGYDDMVMGGLRGIVTDSELEQIDKQIAQLVESE